MAPYPVDEGPAGGKDVVDGGMGCLAAGGTVDVMVVGVVVVAVLSRTGGPPPQLTAISPTIASPMVTDALFLMSAMVANASARSFPCQRSSSRGSRGNL